MIGDRGRGLVNVGLWGLGVVKQGIGSFSIFVCIKSYVDGFTWVSSGIYGPLKVMQLFEEFYLKDFFVHNLNATFLLLFLRREGKIRSLGSLT